MIRSIIKGPDPLLATVSRPVEPGNPEHQAILQDLADTFADTPRSLGLSAVQIGQPIRAFVMRWGDGIMQFLNPVVAWSSVLNQGAGEECMSYPWLSPVNVIRPREIVLSCEGQQVIHMEGLEARIALHEIDHLNGITIDILRRKK